MSVENPYVRPTLIATRAGLPDPDLLVDLWLDQLIEWLADAGECSSPSTSDVYDIVALYGRLRRCDPEKLEQSGRPGEWKSAARVVEDRLGQWLLLALQVPDPDGWLREANLLADACDDGLDKTSDSSGGESLAEWSEQILTDLDDADLAAWAARRLGLLPEELERGLARCSEWLLDNLDRFFPAGVFIQGVGQTIRSDLPAEDLELAGTADKFVLLLDALEEIEDCLSPPGRTVTPPDDWAGFPEPSLAVAAKTPGSEGLFRRRWRSPPGNAEALLVVGPEGPDTSQVRLNFLAEEEVLATLEGRPVWLAGCRTTIAEGNADLGRSDLLAARQAGRPLELWVGEHRQAWAMVRDR
jgi:hypothetical protein